MTETVWWEGEHSIVEGFQKDAEVGEIRVGDTKSLGMRGGIIIINFYSARRKQKEAGRKQRGDKQWKKN